ncbi:MAG TPA: FAD-binding oxidoreductase [Verrucomicrobiae bacterium]|jgi:glycolate oxidase FAD binding subunit|nr:FAD-binding oxidoreductase [Verrucomicrobiae bacterium]
MMLQPATLAELTQRLAAAAPPEKIERVDLASLNRVVEYTPEDMVVTAEAGITLAALQAELARHGQWLPLDVPHPERATLAEIIDANLSGPHRFGFGTIRDHIIGMACVLADGTVIHSGGKVVKNVAGYDLMKLFIGAQGSLGVVVEATFRLRPLPEVEKFVSATCASLEQADKLIEAVISSPVTPVVLDLHGSSTNALTITVGFAGTREEVEWQVARATELGFNQSGSLEYEAAFWNGTSTAQKISVLPSKMIEAVRKLNGAPFVARAGNGVTYHRGPATPSVEQLPLDLMRRLKDAYDPRHILPALPL